MKAFGATNSEKIFNYLERTFHPEDKVLRDTRENLVHEGLPAIQVGPMDALTLEVITRAIGARRAVEIGTLGGYSGISIARGLAPEGKLYTFEADTKHARVARAAFEKAGLRQTVEVLVGPALVRLREIDSKGPFDLVFIDADKENYPNYLKWAADHLRVGGVVLGDNTLAWDLIADSRFDDPEDERKVTALQKFNQEAATGGRFRTTLLPTSSGLTFGVKIS
jgi:caffeoyl-CoA O-methyltransferase